MCVVSMIGDKFTETFPQKYFELLPSPFVPLEPQFQLATKEDIDKLKVEIESIKKLLKAAKIYDDETGQPNCEKQDKLKLIFDLAKLLGIDMSDLGLNQDGK